MKIRKIGAAALAAAVLAVAAPVTGVLPDVMSVTAFAGGGFPDGYGWADEICTYDYIVSKNGYEASVYVVHSHTEPTAVTIPSEIRVTGNIMGEEIDGEMILKVTRISDEGRCTNVTSLTIPDSVNSIGSKFFENCEDLESVTYKGKTYNREQFLDLYNYINYGECNENGLWIKNGVLTKVEPNIGAVVTIPDNVTMIGAFVFRECTNLKSITIPGSVTEIGVGAFDNCTNLVEVTIKDGVTKINGGFKDVDIHGAFYNCTSLKSITIPDSVTEIGYQAFAGCKSLTSVTIPGKVTEIGRSAFAGCTNLKSATISNGVIGIGDWAFANCQSLTNVTIPDSVTAIGSGAFASCKNLTSITIPASVTSIGQSSDSVAIQSFEDSGLKIIYGVKGSYAETYAKENGYEFKEISDAPKPTQKTTYNSTTDKAGDVDGDGKVSTKDATAILKYVVGLADFEGNSLNNALLTGGEKPSVKDATQILKMVVGLA